MRLTAWPLTDVGRVRSHNEDSFYVDDELGLYVVADGMGGHAGGAAASQTAVEVVSEVVRRGLPGIAGLPQQSVESAVHELLGAAASEASARIFDRAEVEPALRGMGTTLCGVLFHGNKAYFVHVGDSRAYLFRQASASQLTEDHSWLNEQIQAGLLTPEEAAESDLKHIITRSVGFEREVAADLVTVNVSPGDCFLICSDGLSNYLELEELNDTVVDNFYADVPQLVTDVALERGGDDNITVIVVAASNGDDKRGSFKPMRAKMSDTLPPV